MSEAARSHRPEVRREPYLGPAGPRSGASDPLAELAQLVGQEDPFRNVFRPGRPVGREPGVPAAPVPSAPLHPSFDRDGAGGGFHDDYDEHSEHDDERHFNGASHNGIQEAHGWSEASEWDGYAEDTQDPHHTGHAELDRYAEHGDAHSRGMAAASHDFAAPPLTPDLWAERADGTGHGHVSPHAALADENAADARAPRRPLIVLLAVLALTGGGLAATFLSRTGASVGVAGKGTPTIMAAAGPTKVKQVDTSSDSTPEDADSALLNKKGASSGGPVRVVNSQEQPMDLAQLPRTAESQTDPTPSGSVSPFPEPKKVKTFLVRPDGSMVNQAGKASSGRSSLPEFASAGAPVDEAANSDAASASAASRPATPKTGNQAATTPKSPPTSIADLASGDPADAGTSTGKARQPASPGVKVAARNKPVELADASASDAPAPAGQGGFSLQLAASPSEQDARSAFARLQKKYSELGAYKPTIKKADNGDKSVYRLRVGNLSQDEAKTLCSQLQASGGTCFVVHN